MKSKKFIKLFSFVGFLVLSCCFVPKAFAEDYKGIEYVLRTTSQGTYKALGIIKEVEDESIMIEFAQKMRDEHPNIYLVQTPLCKYTLTMIKPRDKYCRGSQDEVAVRWELVEPTGPMDPKIVKKLASMFPMICFDAVNEYGGSFASTYRKTGRLEVRETSRGYTVGSELKYDGGYYECLHEAKRSIARCEMDYRIHRPLLLKKRRKYYTGPHYTPEERKRELVKDLIKYRKFPPYFQEYYFDSPGAIGDTREFEVNSYCGNNDIRVEDEKDNGSLTFIPSTLPISAH